MPNALLKSRPALAPKHAFANTRKTFKTASGRSGSFYSLPALAKTFPNVNRLPVSIRIVLESVLRNSDDIKITSAHVAKLANWQAQAPRTAEIPFVVSRILLQDFTGVPLLCDLAAMRSATMSFFWAVVSDLERDLNEAFWKFLLEVKMVATASSRYEKRSRELNLAESRPVRKRTATKVATVPYS